MDYKKLLKFRGIKRDFIGFRLEFTLLNKKLRLNPDNLQGFYYFTPSLLKSAGVAKLDKASDYESEDSRFESWHLQFSRTRG